MKRANLFLTFIASVTLLTACNSEKEDIERVDLAKAQEIAHDVYVANLPENILKKHKSYETSITMPGVVPDQYDYQVKGMRYTEWGSGTFILYFLDERYAYRVDDYGENTYTQAIGLDINDAANRYTYNPFLARSEPELFNSDVEKVTDLYIQKGLLHFKTEYNETGVKNYFENNYPEEDATGVRVFSEFVVDAKTYEATEVSVKSVKDKVETTRYYGTAKYDAKEPRQVAIMRAAFERPSQNMVRLELDVDLGKESHYKIDVNIPSNTDVTYLCEDSDYVYFDDAEGQTINRWNRMTDLHRYVFRNPTAEQKAKFEELINALMA